MKNTLAKNIRGNRRGFTFVEVGVAMFILSVVALAGAAYYANARMGEFNEWHEQSALYLAEREVEAWQAGGYIAQTQWDSTQGGAGNFLPFGYKHNATPGPIENGWIVADKAKYVTSAGKQYIVKAELLGVPTVGVDFKTSDPWDPNSTGTPFYYNYRSIIIHVAWGGDDTYAGAEKVLKIETRLAE